MYDTLDNQISGVSQQQGFDSTVTFTSQYGLVSVAQLPLVQGGAQGTTQQPAPAPMNEPTNQPVNQPINQPINQPMNQPISSDGLSGDTDVIAMLERLGTLHEKGVLTNEEFAAKKAELLNRL